MDTVLYLALTLLCLLHCSVVQSEDRQAGPSQESLRRYLSFYDQQRRLEELKAAQAARFFAENRAQYLQEEQAAANGEPRPNEGDAEGVPSREQARMRWRGNGQPEVFGDDPPYPATAQLRGDSEGGSVSVDVVPNDVDSGVSSSPQQTMEDQDIVETGQKKSQQITSDFGSTDDGRGKATVKVSGQPFAQPRNQLPESANKNPLGDIYFVVIVAGCSAAAIFGVVAAGYCFYRFQKNSKAAAEVDYPAYGVTGPNKDQTSPNGDRRLAQSAQMYHYQHQKQQMIAVEKATTARNTSASDIDSEEENEEGDYTVYECPGLAPTGEMEVKNPLFHDDSTPMSPPVVAKDLKKP